MYRCYKLTAGTDIKALFSKLWANNKVNHVFGRQVQVSVIGSGGPVGSNLAVFLKRNSKIKRLNLYDDDPKVRGVGLDVSQLPGGPAVSTFAGNQNLGAAINKANIIVMVARIPRKPGNTREEMMSCNGPLVLSLCKAMVDYNPNAFLAISTNPINSIVPFISAYLQKYNCYNPFKVLGVTHIDTARSRAYAGHVLNVDPSSINVPVIGGHSDHTIIPLFSNMSPSHHCLDTCQTDTLTRLVRKAGTEVVYNKNGRESATLAMAWSINEFVDGLVDAVRGAEVILNCYTANPFFGTRFFSGPNMVGANGIIETFSNIPMNEYEGYMLNDAVPRINHDIETGERYVSYIESLGR